MVMLTSKKMQILLFLMVSCCHWSYSLRDYPDSYTVSDTWMSWIQHIIRECILVSARSKELAKSTRSLIRCTWNEIQPCLTRPYRDLQLQKEALSSRASVYCGWLNLKSKSADQFIPLTRNITVVQNFKIHFAFITFDSPWTWNNGQGCSSTGLRLIAPNIAYEDTFCGKRLPWNMDVDSDNVKVELYGHPSAARYTDITFVYEVLHKDVTLYSSEQSVFTIPGVTLSHADRYQSRVYVWHIWSYPNSSIDIQVHNQVQNSNSTGSLIVYDGPGSYSHILPLDFRSSVLYANSSSFCVTIIVSTSLAIREIKVTYRGVSFISRNSLNQPTGCGLLPWYIKSPRISLIAPQQSQRNTVCFVAFEDVPRYYELTISSFRFVGPTTFDESLPINCQYGGLFVYDRKNKQRLPTDYCNTYGKRPPASFHTHFLAMVVVWFSGYSYGNLDVEFKHRTEGCTLYEILPEIGNASEKETFMLPLISIPCLQVRLLFHDSLNGNPNRSSYTLRIQITPSRYYRKRNVLKLGPVTISSAPYARSAEELSIGERHPVLISANTTEAKPLESILNTGDILDLSDHRLYFLDVVSFNEQWMPPYMVSLNIYLLAAEWNSYSFPPGDVTRILDGDNVMFFTLDYSRSTKNITILFPQMFVGMPRIVYAYNCPLECRNDIIHISEYGVNPTTGLKLTYTWTGQQIDLRHSHSSTTAQSKMEILVKRTPSGKCAEIARLEGFCDITVMLFAAPFAPTGYSNELETSGEKFTFHPPQEISWLAAEDVCIGSGGHLASITPSHYSDIGWLIKQNLVSSYWNSLFFIGLNNMDQGSYVWMDGTAVWFTDWFHPLKLRFGPTLTFTKNNNTTVELSSLINNTQLLKSHAYLDKLLATPQQSGDIDKKCTGAVYGVSKRSEGWVKVSCTKKYFSGFICIENIVNDDSSRGINYGEAYINVTNINGMLFGKLIQSDSECPSGWFQYIRSCFSLLASEAVPIYPSAMAQMCLEKEGRPLNVNISIYVDQIESLISNIYRCIVLKDLLSCELARSDEYNIFVRPVDVLMRDMVMYNYSYAIQKVYMDGMRFSHELRMVESQQLITNLVDFISGHFIETELHDFSLVFPSRSDCFVVSRNPKSYFLAYDKWLWHLVDCEEPLNSKKYILCQTDQRNVTLECSALTQFTCHDGSCITNSRVCDKRPDCPDNSDEAGCQRSNDENIDNGCQSHQFQCWPSRSCIGAHLLCDSITDCPDGSDEAYCSKDVCRESEYMCPSGECISQENVCDGIIHCNDWNDEAVCDSEHMCQGFYCLSGRCISRSKRLDFFPDCELGEDEFTDNSNETMLYDVSMNPECFTDTHGYALVSCKILSWDQRAPCFRFNDVCMWKELEFEGCTNSAHLIYCSSVICPSMFKCAKHFCIPFHAVCDGTIHCPQADDEVGCTKLSCPGMLKCAREDICVHPSQVCDGIPQCRKTRDDEINCQQCPDGCQCDGYAIQCTFPITLQSTLGMFTFLTAFNIQSFSDIKTLNQFSNLIHLRATNLMGVDLVLMPNLWQHYNMKYLVLSSLELQSLSDNAFVGLPNLHFLDMSDNNLKRIPKKVFQSVLNLQVLILSNNNIYQLFTSNLAILSKLEHFDISGNDLLFVESGTFGGLGNLLSVKTDSFRICCVLASHVICSAERYLVSTCEDLLGFTIHKVLIWSLGILGFVGNCVVISMSCFIRNSQKNRSKKNKNTYTLLISNMALSDLLMSVYLLTLGVLDIKFMGSFSHEVDDWRANVGCKFLGVLSLISLQSTLFTILVMAIMRMIATLYPIKFRSYQGKQKVLASACFFGWMSSILVAIIPLVSYAHLKPGSVSVMPNGLCMFLDFNQHIGRTKLQFVSAFISVDAVMLVAIAVCYVCIFKNVSHMHINKSDKVALKTNKDRETKIARRIVLVICADCLTWLPILSLNILSLANVPLPSRLTTWVVVLVLPLNSMINPLVYTVINSDIANIVGNVLRKAFACCKIAQN